MTWRHRLFLLLLCLSFLFGITALAEDTGRLTLMPVTETVRPGKGITLSYYAPAAGVASLQLVDAYEQPVLPVDPAHETVAGYNELIWNGTYEGEPAPQGEYALTLRLGDETVSTSIVIGPYAPYLNHIDLDNGTAAPGRPATVSFTASQAGTLSWGVYVNEAYQPLGSHGGGSRGKQRQLGRPGQWPDAHGRRIRFCLDADG